MLRIVVMLIPAFVLMSCRTGAGGHQENADETGNTARPPAVEETPEESPVARDEPEPAGSSGEADGEPPSGDESDETGQADEKPRASSAEPEEEENAGKKSKASKKSGKSKKEASKNKILESLRAGPGESLDPSKFDSANPQVEGGVTAKP